MPLREEINSIVHALEEQYDIAKAHYDAADIRAHKANNRVSRYVFGLLRARSSVELAEAEDTIFGTSVMIETPAWVGTAIRFATKPEVVDPNLYSVFAQEAYEAAKSAGREMDEPFGSHMVFRTGLPTLEGLSIMLASKPVETPISDIVERAEHVGSTVTDAINGGIGQQLNIRITDFEPEIYIGHAKNEEIPLLPGISTIPLLSRGQPIGLVRR
jgi:hypothetical protein